MSDFRRGTFRQLEAAKKASLRPSAIRFYEKQSVDAIWSNQIAANFHLLRRRDERLPSIGVRFCSARSAYRVQTDMMLGTSCEKGKEPVGTITVMDGKTISYKDWGTGQLIVFSHEWPLNADEQVVPITASKGKAA